MAKRKGKKKGMRGRNFHHLHPKARRGNNSPSNLLLIKEERHIMWHKLFGLRNLEEVIALLTRLKRKKDRLAGVALLEIICPFCKQKTRTDKVNCIHCGKLIAKQIAERRRNDT